jgi:anti-sigma factor ChrR (cupin superfamily)
MHPNDTTLNDYVDGSLGPGERSEVDRHAAECAACRQTIEDLRGILGAAKELDLREPPARAWSRIERAIAMAEKEKGPYPFSETAIRKRGTAPFLSWLAAAAALVLATAVGIRYVPARHVDAPAGDAAQSIETELRQAEAHYENAIKGLEAIANTEQSDLDPRTAATLQKNLAVIDQAISESRAAVRAQPASEPAQQSLIDGFKTKIGLLQDTVALINEMRKGNEAGAARIASGLKQQKGT